jgi:hypothetical protein
MNPFLCVPASSFASLIPALFFVSLASLLLRAPRDRHVALSRLLAMTNGVSLRGAQRRSNPEALARAPRDRRIEVLVKASHQSRKEGRKGKSKDAK